MELLLAFLSLLTAATGALTGARAPEGMEQTAQVDIVRASTATTATVVQAAVAPKASAHAVVRAAANPPGRHFAVAASAPLYADRLIE